MLLHCCICGQNQSCQQHQSQTLQSCSTNQLSVALQIAGLQPLNTERSILTPRIHKKVTACSCCCTRLTCRPLWHWFHHQHSHVCRVSTQYHILSWQRRSRLCNCFFIFFPQAYFWKFPQSSHGTLWVLMELYDSHYGIWMLLLSFNIWDCMEVKKNYETFWSVKKQLDHEIQSEFLLSILKRKSHLIACQLFR